VKEPPASAQEYPDWQLQLALAGAARSLQRPLHCEASSLSTQSQYTLQNSSCSPPLIIHEGALPTAAGRSDRVSYVKSAIRSRVVQLQAV